MLIKSISFFQSGRFVLPLRFVFFVLPPPHGLAVLSLLPPARPPLRRRLRVRAHHLLLLHGGHGPAAPTPLSIRILAAAFLQHQRSGKKTTLPNTFSVLSLFFFFQNWYLIEWHLLSFAGVFLGRRLAWSALKALISVLTPTRWAPSFVIVARALITMSVPAALFFLIYFKMGQYPMINLLYLAYP